MAPAKRRRGIDDDGEDEEGVGVVTASSSQRAAKSRKKTSTVRAHENGGSAVSDDDSVDGIDQARRPRQMDDEDERSDPDSDSESVVEAGIIKDMQDDEHFMEMLRSSRINQPNESGIIEEIYCRNFMCHFKLRIKLGPLINFIIGNNGSGKSAVLTALTVCLGAKATATNRGGSLKNLVKEGTDAGMVSVQVKNMGEMAFQHDLYGDAIIVERHFNKTGQSGFKLRSKEGRLITTKRGDLEDMLDFHGLQLDNPMNVLTQDMSRQFLSNSSDHDKYKFFMKGTQLEQLDRDYRLMHDLVDQGDAKLEAREGDVAVLKERMDKAERKKREAEQAETIQEKIKHLEWMHAWAQVEEQERSLERAKGEVTKAEELLSRRNDEARGKSDIYASKDAELEAAKLVLAELEEQLRPLNEDRDEVKTEFDKNKNALAENMAQIRHIREDIKTAQAEITAARKKIETEQKRIEDASGQAQADKLAQLQEAEEEAARRREELLANSDKSALERRQEAAIDEVKAKEEAVQPAAASLREAEARLQNLLRNKGDQMKAFNNNMPNLLRAIRNETRFKEKPVGPLGLHVKLIKPEWSPIVETIFGGVLESFVVTNVHDQAVLRDLQQRCSCLGDIFIGNKRPIDVSANKPQTGYDTLLDVLQIEHDIIRNLFIINQTADQLLLVEDRKTGASLNASRPRNVKSIVTMHDTVRGAGHRFANTSGGSRMDQVKAWHRNPRMQTDIDAQIAAQNANIVDAKRRLDGQRQKLQASQEKLKEAKQAINRFRSQVIDLRRASQEADDRVTTLKEELEQFASNPGTLEALRDELREATETKTTHESTYQDAIEAKDRLNEAQREVKARLDRASQRCEEFEKKISKCKAKLPNYETARSHALREKNLAINLAEQAQKAKEGAEGIVTELTCTVETYVSQASEICERISVDAGLTIEMLDRKIDHLVRQKDDADRRIGGTKEQLIERWAHANQVYNAAKDEVGALRILTNKLKKTKAERTKAWKEFRRHITARAKIMFSLLQKERNFTGSIETDHANRRLSIKVEPDMTKTTSDGREAKTLSGGEKSFSTVCLLLAIWEAMGSPIRCLDEFDVFMDNVNRDISMGMMIQAARRAVGKQYILITPQGIGNLQIEEDMRIHRMSDPERGQTALPFSQG